MRNPKVLYTVSASMLAPGTKVVYAQLDYSLAGQDAWMMHKDDVHAAFLDKYAVGELVEFTQSMGERCFCLPWPPVSEFVRILAAFEGAPARAPARAEHARTHPHAHLHASRTAPVRAPEPHCTKPACVRRVCVRRTVSQARRSGSPRWAAWRSSPSTTCPTSTCRRRRASRRTSPSRWARCRRARPTMPIARLRRWLMLSLCFFRVFEPCPLPPSGLWLCAPLSAIGLRTPPPCRLAPVIASQTPSELC